MASNCWATLARKLSANNFQKSPNLVTLTILHRILPIFLSPLSILNFRAIGHGK